MRRDHLSPRPAVVSAVRLTGVAFAILTLSALAYAAVSTKLTLDRRSAFAESLVAATVTNVDAFANRVNEEQDFFLWITPPEPSFTLHQYAGLIPFDWKAFPEEFVRALVPKTQRDCPVYPVTVVEDVSTRDLIVYNADGQAIYAIHPYRGYDPYRVLNRLHPDLDSGRYGAEYAAWLRGCYDPARVQASFTLLPSEWIDLYAAKTYPTVSKKTAVATPSLSAGSFTLMRMELSESSIVVLPPSFTSTGAVLSIEYPLDYTSGIDVYWGSDLVAADWALAATNLATNGTGTICWTDTSATNADVTNRFYLAANATRDSDGDGVPDARETILYRTSQTNQDSDGDGLVDGYSGVVPTNAYPAGVTTNGGACVEGEFTWHTDGALPDTDNDGADDGWEVAHGHNPTNWNDPPNVRGTVTYAGHQTGTIWVVAVTASNSWATNCASTLSASNTYRISHLEATNYWIRAWRDTDGSGTNNTTEARGEYSVTPVVITNRVLALDFTLTDPDDDSDSLPDYWEMVHFGNTTNTAGADPDGDEYTNLEEYQADTDPTNTLSHPWDISGTVFYAGPQTGTIYVVACTSATDWVAAQYATSTVPGSYTITHLPPNAYYWVKAWRDTSGEGSRTYWEAWGTNSGNPVYLGPNATGADVTLADPDTDGDSIPDWWEVKYGLNPFSGNGATAAAWWKLDEGSGTNIQDSTANANAGVLCGTASNAWTSGVMSNAVAFDGVGAYAQFQHSASLTSAAVSVSLWIRPAHDYTNGSAIFFSKKQPGGSTGYQLAYEQGAVSFLVYAGGSKAVSLPCTLASGVWHHVVGTYGTPNHCLYVDGILQVSTNYTVNPMGDGGTISQGSTDPRLAVSTDATPSNYFAGSMDDVRIYDRSLSSNEVHAVYELGADPDGDGLSNFDEYRYGACPTNSDTDADGLLDGWERDHGSNPSVDESGQSSTRLNYQYDGSGWLRVLSGARSENITIDNEGNVQQLP